MDKNLTPSRPEATPGVTRWLKCEGNGQAVGNGGGSKDEKRHGTSLSTPPPVMTVSESALTFDAFFDPDLFDPQIAVDLELADLGDWVSFLAILFLNETGAVGTRSRDPETWACRFVSGDTSDLGNFFAGVRESAIARHSPTGLSLALAAGAYAWVKLRADSGYSPPGSLFDELGKMDGEDRIAYLRSTAAFHKHSCLIEKIDLDIDKLEEQLGVCR